jgi:hypothetical protein
VHGSRSRIPAQGDLADAEANTNEVGQADAAGEDVPASVNAGQAEIVEHLGLDKGEVFA